jgi:hypothetical protein
VLVSSDFVRALPRTGGRSFGISSPFSQLQAREIDTAKSGQIFEGFFLLFGTFKMFHAKNISNRTECQQARLKTTWNVLSANGSDPVRGVFRDRSQVLNVQSNPKN